MKCPQTLDRKLNYLYCKWTICQNYLSIVKLSEVMFLGVMKNSNRTCFRVRQNLGSDTDRECWLFLIKSASPFNRFRLRFRQNPHQILTSSRANSDRACIIFRKHLALIPIHVDSDWIQRIFQHNQFDRI